MLAPTAETFREFLDQQDLFVFFMTIYVGAGLIANDRRANALQIYLSKPLMRTEYIAGKAAVLFFFLLLDHLGAGDPAAPRAGASSPGSFQFLRKNLFLFPAITVASLLQVLLATFTMLALSSLSKSSRYVAILYAGIIFFTAAIYRCLLRDHRAAPRSRGSRRSTSLAQVVDVIFRLHAPLHDALAGLRSSSSSGSSSCRFRSSSGACAASRWSRERARHDMPIVTADHVSKWYGQVIGLNDVSVKVPPGRHGSARSERRRQVDLHEAHHRPAQAEQGHGDGSRRADLGQSEALFPASGSAPSRTPSTSG